MIPAITPIGASTTNPNTNLTIAADLFSIRAYNSGVLDEENNRLKGLLIATTISYLFSWGLAFFLAPYLFDDGFILWVLKYPWLIYISYFLLFLSYCWIPLSIFLLIQGVILRKKYSESQFTGDKTIGNLSVLLPVVFLLIYVATRLLY